MLFHKEVLYRVYVPLPLPACWVWVTSLLFQHAWLCDCRELDQLTVLSVVVERRR